MTPYYERDGITIYHGDVREIVPALGVVPDVTIADPPYGETSLRWDRWVDGWLGIVPGQNLWCFGSMRMFMEHAADFAGWRFAQDIVWEKHNGSGFHADRFKRVHEHANQFYRGEWGAIYRKPVKTLDATARVIRKKGRPAHTGHIDATPYESVDGGPRLQRSVIKVRSCHGYAEHPTQKPDGIVLPLVEYSCPPSGLVLSLFTGSGTDLDVARQRGCRAIGVEVDERWCEVAAKRLSQSVLPLYSVAS